MDGYGRRGEIMKACVPQAVAQSSSEGRFAPRRKSELPAVAHFEGTAVSIGCTIRDMSTTGARIVMKDGWNKTYDLDHVERLKLVVRLDRVMYDCRIVRRARNEFGLKFLSMPKPIAKLGR